MGDSGEADKAGKAGGILVAVMMREIREIMVCLCVVIWSRKLVLAIATEKKEVSIVIETMNCSH